MKKAATAIIALTAGFLAAGAAQATVVATNDRTAFEAQFSPAQLVRDSFDNLIRPADTITFDSGVMSANSANRGHVLTADNEVAGGEYFDSISADGLASSDTITWTFPTEIVGFGFDAQNVSPNDGVQVSINDGSGLETFLLHDVIGDFAGFTGFTGMGPFTQIIFSTTNGDAFILDNLVFATAPEVPLPAALPLFMAGLAGLGAIGRRRKKAVQSIGR